MRTRDHQRARIIARGAVQGVGFRPFVYRLATELKLQGYVSNSSQGVFIEVEGACDSLQRFLSRLEKEKPPSARIQSLESSFLDAAGYDAFEIRESEGGERKTALILPDLSTCADCLREIFDPIDRRHRYPFTNCTNCGPRFSIIEGLPYDRANTSMKKFAMCADCDREYHDPFDRRFHAQPNACPQCGPQLQLWDENGAMVSERDDALRQATDAVKAGKILALKGIGGFQLIVDARNEAALVRLRERKHREEKPLALLYPSFDAVRVDCKVSKLEERLLLSPESPIVLLRKIDDQQSSIAPSVAPRNPNLGVMLPYTPLHHLLMRDLIFPVVATSGNLSDEPICIDEHEALQRLEGIVDLFLVHNRPIVRHMDDSVVRVMCDREVVLRRARGYAPLPITLPSAIQNPQPEIILALGAHLKNTVALKIGAEVFISQHIGDLETEQAYGAFKRAAADLPQLYDAKVDIVACDMHPDYLSTKYAHELQGAAISRSPSGNSAAGKLLEVQHHWAHVAACMAENEIEPPALGVAWDGTGYGLDGTIWGGEFLLANDESFERVAHFRQFRLPGGQAAIKEPRRAALGILYEMFSDEIWDRHELSFGFSERELALLRQMIIKKINAPVTSSVGRLFDAVASLLSLRHIASFEGQAAMELEFAIQSTTDQTYSFEISEASPRIVNWQPLINDLLKDLERSVPIGATAAKFHNTMAEIVVAVTKQIQESKIVLTGGCFQNRYLTERTISRLIDEGFRPYWHQRIPPNDGGISLGQIAAAAHRHDRSHVADRAMQVV
jgi:hydrogenase maturation protein HypF